ncbi:CobW family GTP-binding protein [Shewanella sp.]|uniref:CobW family GTP-binding protein n=1 Tax=Shewanella sp. TaxID=50422 RepID=UPI003A97203B
MIQANIPTHVITGFLGAGKTTFIQALLQSKPADETWAVLVNEFGEIGIDAELLPSTDGVVIREVPGGCLCCAAGVPLQVAVTQLVAKAKPQRLLIEPTGLGHPQQILRLLSSPQFAHILSLRSSCCVIDPRKLADAKYLQHDTFLQQLHSSELLLLSKSDLWRDQIDLPALLAKLPESVQRQPQFQWSRNDGIPEALMAAMATPRAVVSRPSMMTATSGLLQAPTSDEVAPPDDVYDAQGIIFKQQSSEGYYSYGWRFDATWVFEFDALFTWLAAVTSERLKAVMITNEGIAAINRLGDEQTVSELDDAMESRIEFISQTALDATALQQALSQCRWQEDYR